MGSILVVVNRNRSPSISDVGLSISVVAEGGGKKMIYTSTLSHKYDCLLSPLIMNLISNKSLSQHEYPFVT